jgi:sugar/nucleoside kinase (ribokinase family)
MASVVPIISLHIKAETAYSTANLTNRKSPGAQNVSESNNSASLDVIAIGNAIVDVLTQADDEFLVRHGLSKGAMALIDEDQAVALYGDMGSGVEVSGGSAANTMAGLAGLGGKAGFIGKVKNDQLGRVFAHDLRAAGVDYDTAMAEGGAATARSFILVTPDAQRTMNTFLGASADLRPNDVHPDVINRAEITYLEGYLWDPAEAKEAFLKAADLAHASDRRVAFTTSDAFCVDRWRDEFLDLIKSRVHILFANEAEIMSLYQVDNFNEALQHVRGHCDIAALTRSERGAVILSGDEVHVIDAEPVAEIVDTTGAGDLFAAGVLYGLSQNMDLHTCGRIGAIAAAEIISHFGARPEADLAELVKEKLA